MLAVLATQRASRYLACLAAGRTRRAPCATHPIEAWQLGLIFFMVDPRST
jgi:hypothetical protein